MSNIRKTIAVLLPSMQVGGAERLVLEELAYLKSDPRFAFEVHLVFEKGPFYDKLAELDLPVFVWNAPHKSVLMLKAYWEIAMHLRRSECDILHCHLLNAMGSLLGMLAGIPTVTTVHGDIAFGFLERFGFSRSKLVLACGQKVGRNVSSFLMKEKVEVLNNAIKFREQAYLERDVFLKALGVSAGSFLILSIGRLTRQKGYDDLLYAVRDVVRKSSTIILLIGGDGEDKKELLTLIDKLSLHKHVKLLGVVKNTHELLEHCDLYVNSSRWEGLPMTLLEAMSHRKPIIATNVGSNTDVIIDGKTGLLVEPEKPSALAEAIISLIENKTLRNKLAHGARLLFESEYAIEKHGDQLARYYLELV